MYGSERFLPATFSVSFFLFHIDDKIEIGAFMAIKMICEIKAFSLSNFHDILLSPWFPWLEFLQKDFATDFVDAFHFPKSFS